MRLFVTIYVLIFLGLSSCHRANKGVSFSAIRFHCAYTSNPIDFYQPYFDTLQFYMSKVKPDLISFEETEFTDSCLKHIESEGYQFMPVNTLKEDTQIKFSPIAIKKKSFDFLASSYYIYRNKTLQENKNMLTWYQLKNKHSGHIFYFFRLQLQDTIPSYHSKQIAFDLLKRIDEISAGVPVILMGDFKDSNVTVKKLLTDDWKGVYALSDVKTTNKNMEFLVNDFLKIVSFDAGAANDSLINKLVVRFSFSTGKIGKNTSGAIIPE